MQEKTKFQQEKKEKHNENDIWYTTKYTRKNNIKTTH